MHKAIAIGKTKSEYVQSGGGKYQREPQRKVKPNLCMPRVRFNDFVVVSSASVRATSSSTTYLTAVTPIDTLHTK